MRLSKLIISLAIVGASLTSPHASAQRRDGKFPAKQRPSAAKLARFKDNSCVICHAAIAEPLSLSTHFYEWLGSRHETGGIACDKCHGGDPTAKVAAAAHNGMKPNSSPESRLNGKNLIATCGACHQQISAIFAKSTHYRKLENSAAAPNCTTCHQHMAASVIYWPPETGKLCATCHNKGLGNSAEFLAAPRNAEDVISAFSRADEIVEWTRHLLNSGRSDRLKLAEETEQLRQLDQTLSDAKLNWHEFNLDASKRKADEVFNQGYQLKEGLWKKLPVNQ